MSNYLINTLAAVATAGLLFSNNVFAADANLKINVTGANPHNTYFLCIANEGCVSVHAASQGKVFPLTPGKLGQAFVLNSHNLRLAHVALPDSCQVNVNSNQTLQVTGHITAGAHGEGFINDLGCRLVG